MALPLGKLSILIGAGILGSVLAKEGRLSNVSDFCSGAFKIVFKQIKQADSTPSVKKPRNDALLAQQVNSLREELQILASNGPITIVTSSGSGSSRYGIVIIVVVVGYGYIWWKGWKLPDMMFATKRGLTDACTSISKQLENVYASISATKRHLSSRIDRVDSSMDEFVKLTAATEIEVSKLQGRAHTVGEDVKSVRHAVLSLETKINRIEEKQELTNEGVYHLCDYAWNVENSKSTERIQASSSSFARPALELSPVTPSSRTESLPSTGLSLEPPSPCSNGPPKVQRPLHNTVSASGLKDLNGIFDVGESPNSPTGSNGIRVSEETSNGVSNSGLFGLKLPGFNASFLTRTRSAVNSIKLSSGNQ